jgi:hypothetical protein
MHTDEQVGVILIGNAGAVSQFHKHVGLAGIYYLHIGFIGFDKPTQLQNYFQGYGRLAGRHTRAASILAAMAGIQYYSA